MTADPHKKLTDDQKKRLRIFQLRVQDLRDSGLVTSGRTALKLTMSLTPNASGKARLEGYDEDHFRAFMQTLRQFTLQKDDIHFDRICNIIRRNCPSEELRAWLTYARGLWENTLGLSPFRYNVDGEEITVRRAMDLLLYSGLSHTQLSEHDFVQSLPADGKNYLKFILETALLDLLHALHLVDAVLYHWLDHPEKPVPPVE